MIKEECEIALARVKINGDYCEDKDYEMLKQLIEEHFELKRKYSKILENICEHL